MTYENVVRLLEKYNQQDIIRFYNKLDSNQKDSLIHQIENIDFELMNKLYNQAIKGEKVGSDNITPMPVIDKEKISVEDKYFFEKLGVESIRKGELAFVTMAGRTRN